MGKIAAVTGGTGFIGRALVRKLLLSEEYEEVRVLTREHRPISQGRLRFYEGDITQDPLAEFVDGVDVLFHCAGAWRYYDQMRAVNVDGTARLLKVARGRIRRWVQLSSVGAYGGNLREGTVTEESDLAPFGLYETTKTEADVMVSGCNDFETVLLRPSNVFGPGMHTRSLHQLVAVIERGLFFYIGRGAIATYVFVDDVADALAMCAKLRGVYNLSDDRPLEDFIGAIANALGRPAPRMRLPEMPARMLARVGRALPRFPLTDSRVNALTRRVTYPSEKLRSLGFRFRVSIEKGLQRFIEHVAV